MGIKGAMTKKHLWIMLACCLLPVAAIVAVNVFKVPVGTLGLSLLLLLCPVGHLLLMRGMRHQQKMDESGNPIIEDIKKEG